MAGFYEAATHFDMSSEPLKELLRGSVDLGRTDRLGMTLLHYACREGHLSAVQMLVESGVPLETQDRDARTPLHFACLMAGKLERTRGREHVAISEYLVQEGAATSTQDKFGHTPLSYLPQRAKRIGLMTPAVDGREAQWAIEQVSKGGNILSGSVAQSAAVRVMH